MDKNQIDIDAEREVRALNQQGRSFRDERLRLELDYNKVIFESLFSYGHS